MEKTIAVVALAALAQDNRLDVFRLLVQAGPAGPLACRPVRSRRPSISHPTRYRFVSIGCGRPAW